MVKNLPTMWEAWVRLLDWKDPMEKSNVTDSSILVWSIPWTEQPGGFTVLQRVGHDSDFIHSLPKALHIT